MSGSKKISLTKTIHKDGTADKAKPSLSASVPVGEKNTQANPMRLSSSSPAAEAPPAETSRIPASGSVFLDSARWLTATLGPEPFSKLKESPYFHIPLVAEDASMEEWLAGALKTLFSDEDMGLMAERLTSNVLDRMDELQQNADAARQERSNAMSAKKAMAGKMRSSIPLPDLVEVFIGRGMDQQGVLKLLHKSMENPTDGLPDFVIGLCKGWPHFEAALASTEGNEQTRLDIMHQALTTMLASLSGRRIPERRAILEEMARVASSRFSDFEFVSPEETRQVDPKLHNAAGLGGTTISEGITYAVIRTSNHQTVKFADVKAGS